MAQAAARNRTGYHGDCPDCGKRRYGTRKDAKGIARKAHAGENMIEYRCGDYWHLSHAPHHVVRRGIERARSPYPTAVGEES